jgi:hypothetical protein
MRIEDAIAAVEGKASEAVRLHQGVVVDESSSPPWVSVGDAALQIPAIGTVQNGDVVQILSAGGRWVILGTVTPGSAPSLVPSDGWAWDRKGSAACTVQVPDTRMSFSGDSIAQREFTDRGYPYEGQDPGTFTIDQGYYLMKHQIDGTRFCTATLTTDPVAKNHVAIQLTGPGGTSEPWDFYNATAMPLDSTTSSVIHMFVVGRKSGTFEVGWGTVGPLISVNAATVDTRWRKGINYIRANAVPIPGDPNGIHVYESELNPDGTTRVWIDGTLTAPTMSYIPSQAGITHPMCVPLVSEPLVNYMSGTCYLYEWMTTTDMDDAGRQEVSQYLRDKYLP